MKLRAWFPFTGLAAVLLFVSCGKKEKQETVVPKPVAVAKVEGPPKPNLDDPEAPKPETIPEEEMTDEEEPSLPDNEATPPPTEPVPPGTGQATPAPAPGAQHGKVKKKTK